ncbi:MAG: hypothetical protein COB02_16430 [Candidatus Cloacimonadota bacterium]|nr:MAG: hypothetical protein COB02_16430 [Candidatus Cloacimonadota bacterium]
MKIKNFTRSILGTMVFGLLINIISVQASGDMSHSMKKMKSSHKMKPPFGQSEDVMFSQKLWNKLLQERLVGPNSIKTNPYKGQHPHGAILETIMSDISIGEEHGDVFIKKNYGGKGISRTKVKANRSKWLKAVTVMFRRYEGYDPEDKNFFWVKYKPDGSLHTNKMKMKLAGKVAKGKPMGCIACHKAAPGKDFLFIEDIKTKRKSPKDESQMPEWLRTN